MLATIRLNKNNKTIRIVNRDGTLRLTKRTKTMKVVNRVEVIKLQHTGKTGPQGIEGPTGPVGTSLNWQGEWNPVQSYEPSAEYYRIVEYGGSSYLSVQPSVGEVPENNPQYWALMAQKGDTGVSTFVRVHHGSDPNVTRPSALYVEWVGSVAPNNATIEDTWVDTA